jgi:hypothetical protein
MFNAFIDIVLLGFKYLIPWFRGAITAIYGDYVRFLLTKSTEFVLFRNILKIAN